MDNSIKDNKENISNIFLKYVFQNIVGMIGMSAYILADTFFISKSAGSNGITTLNLVLPIYSLIFAIGSMVSMGSAIKYKILKSRNDKNADTYFLNAIVLVLIASIPFIVLGAFFPEEVLKFMGGDPTIVEMGIKYTRIFMIFAPCFMINYVISAFVRNDNDPTRAMIATFTSSIFNIIMDYILVFPVGMGIAGAALATAISPIVGILINITHFMSKNNNIIISIKIGDINILRTIRTCTLGISAFVGEISSGVTTMVFNIILLRLSGNLGVAAYGIIANISIVCIAIFSGIAQGAQPLFSEAYGKGKKEVLKKLFSWSVIMATISAAIMIAVGYLFANDLVDIFNSENNMKMAVYAIKGIKIYFIGFLFAGFNIIATGYLSAIENGGLAFVISIIRGFVAIIISAIVMSKIFGMLGVFGAFCVAEFVTSMIIVITIKKSRIS